MNSAKTELHSLIDSLSEYQANKLRKVVRVFITEFLTVDQEDKEQAIIKALMNAPEDDDPLTVDELAAIAEAEEDMKAGRTRSLADIAKDIGL